MKLRTGSSPGSSGRCPVVVSQQKLGSRLGRRVGDAGRPALAAATLEGVEEAEPVAGLVDHRVAEVVARWRDRRAGSPC